MSICCKGYSWWCGLTSQPAGGLRQEDYPFKACLGQRVSRRLVWIAHWDYLKIKSGGKSWAYSSDIVLGKHAQIPRFTIQHCQHKQTNNNETNIQKPTPKADLFLMAARWWLATRWEKTTPRRSCSCSNEEFRTTSLIRWKSSIYNRDAFIMKCGHPEVLPPGEERLGCPSRLQVSTSYPTSTQALPCILLRHAGTPTTCWDSF